MITFKTQVAAIAQSLLNGEILTIMNGFQKFACSNIPREISRGIEEKFGVEVSRERKEFNSQYGQPGFYYRYRLNRTEYNKAGIELMKDYVKEHSAPGEAPKTDKEAKLFKQQKLFLDSM